MFNRSGNLFLGTFGVALFALLLNFTLPASIAIAAENGEAGYLLEVCSSSGVTPIRVDNGDLATDSIPVLDLTEANHSLCSYCSIHHGGVSINPGLLSLRLIPISDIASWFVTPAPNTKPAHLNLFHAPRAPPHA